MDKNNILEIHSLSHSFLQGERKIDVLKNINLKIRDGEMIALEGPSGVGKSTLLQIAGLLETATRGDVVINRISCKDISDSHKSNIRGEQIGLSLIHI